MLGRFSSKGACMVIGYLRRDNILQYLTQKYITIHKIIEIYKIINTYQVVFLFLKISNSQSDLPRPPGVHDNIQSVHVSKE